VRSLRPGEVYVDFSTGDNECRYLAARISTAKRKPVSWEGRVIMSVDEANDLMRVLNRYNRYLDDFEGTLYAEAK